MSLGVIWIILAIFILSVDTIEFMNYIRKVLYYG